ncbi:hypothetical protein F511_01180 [Dorcoceras hygrometricum]|uniref:Uncharacterized protein n=1 Tax=Dorcoceras hygrometricum TaxID=472368 RepID=A0A2Z7BYC5_9LAMI|nr:hypothetical protein F511_01180 [Dorcoceras hygrometricum]
MAEYQILALKLLGPFGTGPKQTLEVKNSVATPPRVRRMAVARRRPPPAQRAAHCRMLRAARPAIGTVVACSYSAVVRTLQFRRAHATAPPCARYSAAVRTLQRRRIQLVVGSQPLRLRNHNFGLTHRIMVKRLATSPHDPLGITDSACKNQLVMVSVQYDPFNTYIPIRSTTIGKSRVARDLITMHTSRRSNNDIACVTSIGYPRMKASGESSTTKHRLLHASGPHPIRPPNDPN